MKICVFGAASAHIDDIYIKTVEKLGEEMAKRGHSLVFGAGATGLMGAAARGVKKGGGFIHGVIPHFFREEGVELIYEDCDKITYTDNMAERKKTMEDDADAFIITPGGVGTFEEFFEVLTLKQLGRHDKPIAILNIENYYDDLEKFMNTVTARKFITFKCWEMYSYFNTVEETLNYLENYKPQGTPWQKLKIGD
ncbi:MAG: TIGR00730 family Rossman fold protein [Clostridia bacterium]|nr:TIGR00730 family Rossman fold protein [Clostridia bacterium]MDE7214958.1 TIGR00730 family Rossman fold protein [Clostridia bacterium]